MPPRTLPPELGLLVIDHLGVERDYIAQHSFMVRSAGVIALRQCALVCRDWLHRTRQNLYRTVCVENERAWRVVRVTLKQHPELRTVVRVLRVQITYDLPFWEIMLFMQTMLVPRLCTFHLHSRGPKISMDNATRSCLRLRFHTVSSLVLSSMSTGQAVYIFRAFPALRSLQCIYIGHRDTEESIRISQQTPRTTPCPQLVELKVCGYAESGCMGRN